MVYIIFDSYVEQSLKDCECNSWIAVSPIDSIVMTPDNLIPLQIKKLWASLCNK